MLLGLLDDPNRQSAQLLAAHEVSQDRARDAVLSVVARLAPQGEA
jgi:hypothetical protein